MKYNYLRSLSDCLLLGTFTLFLLAVGSKGFAQCNNLNAFGTATVGPLPGNSATIGGQWAGEYGTWNGIQSAYSYTTSSSMVTDFITVRSGTSGGPVVVSGLSPVTWTATLTGSYYIHVNTNAACGTQNTSRTITTTNNGPSAPCTNPVNAGSAQSSVASACEGQNFTLSLNGATIGSGMTYQWQSSPNNSTWTPIAGATNSTHTATQTAATYYRCVVTCVGGTPANSASVLVGQNSFLNCYCTSSANFTADEDIVRVKVESLDNVSTCTTTGGPGSIAQRYSNYTNLPAPYLARGVTYPMTVDIGTCGTFNYTSATKVYIDYNRNGLFTDPGEEVHLSAAVNGPYSFTFDLTVPMTASLGITRMRVVNVEGGTATSIQPCGTYGYGETEDYYVELMPVPTCPQPTSFTVLNTTTTSVSLDWTPGGSETKWQIEYGAPGFTSGTIVNVTTSSDTIIGNLPSFTFFEARVRGICGAGDTSFWSPRKKFNTFGLGQYMEMDVKCDTNGFIDISTLFNSNPLTGDGEAGFTLPWPFYFQGAQVTQVTVGNNGAIVFNNINAQISPFNANTMATTNDVGLYPFWDDLDDNTANIYWGSVGTAPNRRFIVQWNAKHDLFAAGLPFVFQVIMEESTGKVYYQYNNRVTGSTTYDFGASATIGLAGTNQDFAISFNNNSWLTNNTCANFYYTNCPKPTNLVYNYITAEEAGIQWTPGLFGETQWTVIYGPAGFDPATGGTPQVINNTPNATLLSLSQLTTYDVYIYSNCSPGNNSFALIGQFTTLPFCSNPTNFTASVTVDTIFTNWNWAASDPMYPSTGFQINYGIPGFNPLTDGTIDNSDNIPGDTTPDPALFAGGVYEVYVRGVCDTLVSGYVGPLTVVMPRTNDNVCGAELIPVDGITRIFSNAGATIQTNEQSIAPPATGNQTTTGWGNNTMTFTTWHKFLAPASGEMRINGTERTFNGQMAVYQVVSCSDFSGFTLVAANDDAIEGLSFAPNFTICGLTPGAEYYLVFDSHSTTATGQYALKMSSIDLDAGNPGSLVEICYRDTVNLFSGISGYQPGGVWNDIDGTFHIVNDSLFNTQGLAYDTYNFEYRLTDGCATDAVIGTYRVFPPSMAGTDGSLTICKNQPFSALTGLGGTVDIGGQWFNANNQTLPNSNVQAGTLNVAGVYNYTYVVGNGVCPNDTSVVSVQVQANCDWLGVIENQAITLQMAPNPTQGNVTISSSITLNEVELVVMDVQGKVLFKTSENKFTQIDLDLSGFERGTYLVKLVSEQGSSLQRIVKE